MVALLWCCTVEATTYITHLRREFANGNHTDAVKKIVELPREAQRYCTNPDGDLSPPSSCEQIWLSLSEE